MFFISNINDKTMWKVKAPKASVAVAIYLSRVRGFSKKVVQPGLDGDPKWTNDIIHEYGLIVYDESQVNQVFT